MTLEKKPLTPFDELKQLQQDQRMRKLIADSFEEKAKIVLENSGFAKAIHENRESVHVCFAGKICGINIFTDTRLKDGEILIKNC